MPFWASMLLIAVLGTLAIVAIGLIVLGTHRRLPNEEPLHGDPTNFAAPLPLHIAEADSMTERELVAEHNSADAATREGEARARRSA